MSDTRETLIREQTLTRRCTLEGCEDDYLSRGYCGKHYQRWRKFGDPMYVRPNLGNRTVRVTPEIRTCRDCGRVGPASEFRRRRNVCPSCANAYKKAWKLANPDKVAASLLRQSARIAQAEIRRRARNNGLDPEMVAAYYNAHDGRCEICGNPPRPGGRDLNMDHDHATGEFRGMLCDNCNAGIGRFKDDTMRLESAILYLKRHAQPTLATVASEEARKKAATS